MPGRVVGGVKGELVRESLEFSGCSVYSRVFCIISFIVTFSLKRVFLLWVQVFGLHVCLSPMCMTGANTGQQTASDLLELQLQVIVSCV